MYEKDEKNGELEVTEVNEENWVCNEDWVLVVTNSQNTGDIYFRLRN